MALLRPSCSSRKVLSSVLLAARYVCVGGPGSCYIASIAHYLTAKTSATRSATSAQASAHCVAEARVSDNSTKFCLTHVSVLPDHAKKNSQIQATTATATAKAPNGNSEWARRRRSAARASCNSPSITVVSGCMPPSTRRAIRPSSSSV